MRLLLPLFIGVPIVEMLILIQVGGLIGALPTIGLVLLTAVIGLHLLRQQGLSTLMRAKQKMADGQLPAEEVVTGLLLAVGGALLLTPGFFTDTLGFLCLLPGPRQLLVKSLISKGVFQAMQAQPFAAQDYTGAYSQSGEAGDDSIDGECSPVDENKQLGQ
ncbi:MAG: FxsA family protein [Pseudomonadales bacterium]|nr:FxsA family protein [Pseudomonadales bacterium]